MTFPFIGGSYSNQIARADAQSSINLYLETDKSGAGKSKMQLVGTPGLKLFRTVGAGPIRGIWIGENRMFVVSSNHLWEVFSNPATAPVDHGDVGTDAGNSPAQVFPNGNQIAIVSAGFLYYDNGSGAAHATFPVSNGRCSTFDHTLYTEVDWLSGDKFDATMIGRDIKVNGINYTARIDEFQNPQMIWLFPPLGTGTQTNVTFQIPGANIPASSGTYMDGYAIVSVPASAQINISGLYDFSSWNVLDYSLKEGYPDHIAAVIADQSNLYLLGTSTIEVWRDTGDADFPFQRIPGEVLQIGCVAPYSCDKLPDGIALLGTDYRGGPMAFLLQGYQYSRISTPPLEGIWQQYSTVSDAVGFAYLDAGHSFYVLSFPTANATWVYDRTEDQWHRRGYDTSIGRVRGYLHGYVFGQHFVGDWNSNKLYTMSQSWYDDDLANGGKAITRQRIAGHIATENKRLFYSQFTLDVQTGEIASPSFTLDWSQDGGNTWSNQHTQTPSWAAIGQYNTRFNWRRLGHSRMRTFRVTTTAAMRHNWVDGYFEAAQSSD